MQSITPNLWFDGTAEEAVDRYIDIFDDATVQSVTRYDDAMAAASGQPVGSVLTIDFDLLGNPFVALNGGSHVQFTPAISFTVSCPSVAAVDDLWHDLSQDGEIRMPLDSYPFSDRYGWTDDAFGVSWQVIHSPSMPDWSIIPTLMFVDERAGQAEEAMEFYTDVFTDGTIGDIVHYGPGHEPNSPNSVMYGEFTIRDQRFSAMDSGIDHGFAFAESISFIVDCTEQSEIDYYWKALTVDGGAPGQCGWLTDHFGISWQIVPRVLQPLLQDVDEEKAARVADAMLAMEKLDIAGLEAAYAG